MECPIERQAAGLPLGNQETKISYEVRSKKGYAVSNFQTEERARGYIDNVQKANGDKAPVLRLFRVTTIIEAL